MRISHHALQLDLSDPGPADVTPPSRDDPEGPDVVADGWFLDLRRSGIQLRKREMWLDVWRNEKPENKSPFGSNKLLKKCKTFIAPPQSFSVICIIYRTL